VPTFPSQPRGRPRGRGPAPPGCEPPPAGSLDSAWPCSTSTTTAGSTCTKRTGASGSRVRRSQPTRTPSRTCCCAASTARRSKRCGRAAARPFLPRRLAPGRAGGGEQPQLRHREVALDEDPTHNATDLARGTHNSNLHAPRVSAPATAPTWISAGRTSRADPVPEDLRPAPIPPGNPADPAGDLPPDPPPNRNRTGTHQRDHRTIGSFSRVRMSTEDQWTRRVVTAESAGSVRPMG